MIRIHAYSILKPTTLVAIVLITTTILVSLRLTTNIVDANVYSLRILIVALVATILASLFYLVAPQKHFKITSLIQSHDYQIQAYKSLDNACSAFSLVFVVLSLVGFALTKGFPLLWLITGSADLDYQDSGVPSLQGVTYTCFYFIIAIQATFSRMQIKLPSQMGFSSKLFRCFLYAYPLLLIARGLTVYAIIAFIIPRIFYTRVRIKHLAYVLIFFILIFPLFYGIVGDNRQGISNPFNYLVPTGSPLEGLPSGYTWVYVYITGPINNVLKYSTVQNILPSFEILSPMYNLVPGALKPFLFSTDAESSSLILDSSINVTSFFGSYFLTLGITGVVAGLTLLIVVARFYYLRARRGDPWMLIGYAQLIATIVLLPFFDNFLTVSTFFILAFTFIMSSQVKRSCLPSSGAE